jgi:hypothetical protein
MAQQILPDFLQNFVCKCGECRRTCCRDWEVRLTKQEFLASRSNKLDPASHAVAKNLRRNPSSQGDDDYALCRMRPDGFCTLLTEHGLCAWKKMRGEGLCAACDDYPNTYISFLEDQYVFPSLSCEAIMELLLPKADPIRLVSKNMPSARNCYNARIGKENFFTRPLLSLYPKLLQWGLTLLQNRRYSLDDRMVLLASALCLIDWMERCGRAEEVLDAMEKFSQAENLEQVLHKHDQYTIGPKALLTVNGDTFVRFIDHAVYQACARRVLDGLGIEVEETEKDGDVQRRLKLADRQKYLQRRESLAGFMSQKEVHLEHIMVCQYLRSMMPVAKPSVWDNLKFFNVCYALLKGLLYGSFDSSPGDAEVVDAIMVIHRMFIHNYDAYQQTLEYLEAIQLADLTSMVALAKG